LAGRRPGAAWTGRRPDTTILAALVTGLAALAVYWTTLLRGVGLWDTAEVQVVLPTMGTMHPTGSPAYVVLGWLASVLLQPFGPPALTINLLSAILAALAAGLCVLVLRRLAVPLPIAIAVALGFALTPVVWGIGSAADVHALHLVLVVAVTLGLLRWGALVADRRDRPDDLALRARGDRALVLTAAVFGVAVANHGLTLLLVPAVCLYVLAVEPRVVRRPKVVVAALGACLGTAALLYLELPLRAGPFRAPLVYGHPENFAGFWEILLARQFQGDVGSTIAGIGPRIAQFLGLVDHQFGPLWILVLAGLVMTAVRRPHYALFSGTATAVTCAFAVVYTNAGIERYYLGPVFFAWTWVAVLAGALAERLTSTGQPGALGEPAPAAAPWSWPQVAPVTVAAAMIGLSLLVPTGLVLNARWQAADRSHDRWAADWLDQVFAAVEPDGVIVSWWSFSTPIWYGQIIGGRRPDILLVDDRTRVDENLGEVEDVIDTYLGTRPVYVIRAQESDVKVLAQEYAIEPVGRPDNLYRVTGHLETQP